MWSLTNKQTRLVAQILPFGIISAIFSSAHVMLELGVLGEHPVYPSTGNPFDPNPLVSIGTSLLVGVLIGVFEVLYVNAWFKERRFYQKVLFKAIIYTITIALAALTIITTLHSISLQLSPLSPTVRNYAASFVGNFAFWSIIFYYFLAIIASIFYKEVSDNLGQTVTLKFFSGKYHRPKYERRVFMFLDMKSSTTHAEQLGHITYFELLKDYYEDISQPILDYGGEIYQYVGDEIVISWRPRTHYVSDALACFFAMKTSLAAQGGKYLKNYGIVPTFKAGVHLGNVTTGEIGTLKKDIVFTGDTLNTTARIQSLCNRFGAELLVSETVLEELSGEDEFTFTSLGGIELRGKDQEVDLFSVTQRAPSQAST